MHIVIASSTSENKKKYTAEKIAAFLKMHDINLENVKISFQNVYTADNKTLEHADIVVLIGSHNGILSVPVVDGTAFIARIPSMEEMACKEILSYFKT